MGRSREADATVRAVRGLARTARLLERSTGDLTLPQYRVLAAVAAGDERASRIARKLDLGKPTISASVEALTHRGLLDRTGVAGDQRATRLGLTPTGARLLAEVEAAMVERLEALLADRPDHDALLSALAGLGEAIDAWGATR